MLKMKMKMCIRDRLSSVMLGPIVIVVVVTTIISPILLKLAFSDKNNNIALNPDGK